MVKINIAPVSSFKKSGATDNLCTNIVFVYVVKTFSKFLTHFLGMPHLDLILKSPNKPRVA